MGRVTGPRAKISRATGIDLDAFSPLRSLSTKCKHDRRPGKPLKRTDRSSDYGKQLEMKKAICSYYGLRDKQFRRFVAEAERLTGSTPANLMSLLESRLDNVVYRMGFAVTRREARQLVAHKKITLNGSIHKSPSTVLKQQDVVSVRDNSKSEARILQAIEIHKDAKVDNADWINVDHSDLTGSVVSQPDLTRLNETFKPSLVIEFYSKS
ncbi:30S ribosomal protein S4 [Gammaproteobacteria bacterium]|nr:30S ribosomal protein S4 [Gammaproteobacteria bacterium]